jgi:hypothetical protein
MRPDSRPARVYLAIAAVLAVAVSAVAYVLLSQDGPTGPSPAERQSQIAAKGRRVMPFDLDRTTHRFDKSDSGGVQSVIADDPQDQRQIELIREHLTKEAGGFAQGDFGDPASIHGTDMPGLQDLQRGHDRVEVRYTQLPDGARINYTTSDSSLVHALHAWFDAQVSDHGSHAEHK